MGFPTETPVGWISLDEGDNDWNRFVLYWIKACQNYFDGFANQVVEMLYSVETQDSEMFLPYFINQISEIGEPFLIVLDDYQIIKETKIHDLILTILENQLPNMHLVISSRADSPWPLVVEITRGAF